MKWMDQLYFLWILDGDIARYHNAHKYTYVCLLYIHDRWTEGTMTSKEENALGSLSIKTDF
jgi:hypothetical protein